MRKAWVSICYMSDPVPPLIPFFVCNGNCKICEDQLCLYI